jgi:hypothetical protein
MFDIEVCHAGQIVLVRFHGQLAESDFALLDKLARRPAAPKGRCSG